jgi:hypothetical protein
MKKTRTTGLLGWIMGLRGSPSEAYAGADGDPQEAGMEKRPQSKSPHTSDPDDSRQKVSVLSTHSFDVQGDVAKRTISTAKELLKHVPSGRK